MPTASPGPTAAALLRRAKLRKPDVSRLTILRRRSGRGFSYWDAYGGRVTDEATLERIRSLAIPPAYREVRIADDPRCALQATGRDEAGRLQHRYHPAFDVVREERKAARLEVLLAALPRIRARVAEDLALAGTPRAKALACAVAIIDRSHIRVGSEAYARDNGSHGAATLLKSHAEIGPDGVALAFRGKGGKAIDCVIEDAALARALAEVAALPGERLLQFARQDGPAPIAAGDVNAYLREAAGAHVSAKDLRMLGASAAAVESLAALAPARADTVRKRQLAGVMRAVSQRLFNTPAVARKSYVPGVVVRAFQSGALARAWGAARRSVNRARVENALRLLVRPPGARPET